MGSSHWNDEFYKDRETERVKTGTSAFAYSAKMDKARHADRKVHAQMDPKGVTRESRDSVAHPESLAIGVVFDVTGSMRTVPTVLQKQLPKLMSLLTNEAKIKDPQVLFGAVGDFNSDRVAFQAGQFESGIEMDDDLGRMFLEGGGGGTNEESYQEALYFFARHTSIDCFEKRNKKGYLFLIGDESPYDRVTKREALEVFGDDVQADVLIENILREVKEKYEVFFIIPAGTMNAREAWLQNRWTDLLGAGNVLFLDHPDRISETISLTVAARENPSDVKGPVADKKSAKAPKTIRL